MSANLLSANLRLEERAHQIAEANAAKSRFLANVSHELRTPINAIVGYNSLALDGVYGELPEPLKKAHERIRAAAEHLLKLVDDVLDLSKIEVGRLALDLEPVDLRALLDGIITVVQPIAESKGVQVNASVDPDLPRITSDASRLRQILLNLMSNSIKFSDGGKVALSAKRSPRNPDNEVAVSVSDSGIGIAEKDQERIFEEFEQVRPSGRGDSMQRGTGLGLAISRKLARMLGGELRVQSQLGRGAIFTLVLPVTAPAETTPDVTHSPATGVPIIGVDDLHSTVSADGSHDAEEVVAARDGHGDRS
jgi:signal transduction histidine kinase